MATRNPIIEADYEDDSSLPPLGEDEDAVFEVGELTDEDVQEEMAAFDERKRAEVDRSRQRGRGPARAHKGHDTPAKTAERARTPVREKAVTWRPVDSLDAPPARTGMEQRWIRYQLGSDNDPRNWSRKTRDGWVPRKLDTVAQSYVPPTIRHGQLGEVIGVGDLILCERPREIGVARRKYFRDKTARQRSAAERRHIDRAERSGHPIEVEHPHEAPSVGRGRRVAVQDDEG